MGLQGAIGLGFVEVVVGGRRRDAKWSGARAHHRRCSRRFLSRFLSAVHAYPIRSQRIIDPSVSRTSRLLSSAPRRKPNL